MGMLTEREMEVAGWLVMGYPPFEIAQKLGMKPYSVKQHLKSMYHKFGIHDGIRNVRLAVMLAEWERNN